MPEADPALPSVTAAGVLRVAVDCPLRSLLDYLPPAGMRALDLPAGSRVRVPMGARSAVGVVVAHAEDSQLAPQRLRRVTALLDAEPLFDATLLELLRWTASYYQHPPGEVFAAALPVALRAGQAATAQESWLLLTDAGRAAVAAGEPKRAPRQRALATLLATAANGLAAAALDAVQPEWRSSARALSKRGWTELLLRDASPAALVASAAGLRGGGDAAPELSAAQTEAVAAVDGCAGRFGSFLLQGATGSGKTEVYLRLVLRALERGTGALVLVPEIGLTPQLLERFRSRLRVPIAVLHSALSDGERLQAWRAVRGERRAW